MNKEQALYRFWSMWGLPAYDELSVPDEKELEEKNIKRYITYRTVTGSIDEKVALSASIWDRDTSWKYLSEKVEEIDKALANGGITIRYDNGMMWVCKASPFAQRMTDDSDRDIKREYLNIQAEFFSL